MDLVSLKCHDYADKFPFGMQDLGKAMSKVTHLAVMRLLMDEGPMSRDEILETLQVGRLDTTIKDLYDGGMIHMTDQVIDDGELKSFKYEIYPVWSHVLTMIADELNKLTDGTHK